MLADQHNTATIEIKDLATGDVQRVLCTFGGVEGKRLRVQASQRIAPFTTLTVEYSDVLFLGEVVTCTQDCATLWHVEIGIEQMLNGLQSLVQLRSRLLGDPIPAYDTRPAFAAR